MDSKIINIANCKTCKKNTTRYWICDFDNILLLKTAKTKALYESTDGPTDNPLSWDGSGNIHQTVSELAI
jgi:hypothetical protein